MLEKYKYVIYLPRSVCIGKNCALGLEYGPRPAASKIYYNAVIKQMMYASTVWTSCNKEALERELSVCRNGRHVLFLNYNRNKLEQKQRAVT